MSNFNTSGLLQALDRIKPDLKPLPQHFITSQDQHTRELYATLLAAVLLSDGQVSEPQSRLFGMLLQSMQLEPVPARFFELAQQLDAGKLKQLIQALSHQDQQCALMIDALILARLDSALSQSQTDLLAELLDCFGFSKAQAGLLVDFCEYGLGINSAETKILNNLPSYVHFLDKKINPITAELWSKKEASDFDAGVWTDIRTGLVWARVKAGQTWENGKIVGDYTQMEWDEAANYCEDLRLGGFSDWRLPRKAELDSLRSKSSQEFIEFLKNKRKEENHKCLEDLQDQLELWTACDAPRQGESNYVYTVDFSKHHDTRSYAGSHYSPGKHYALAVRGTTNVLKFETTLRVKKEKSTGFFSWARPNQIQ